MNKTPKNMISKYNGKCDKCGRVVIAGEPILWLSRGVIECNDCTGGAQAPAQPKPTTAAGNWSGNLATAMDWDNSAPDAGASIKTPTKTPQKAVNKPKAKPAPKPEPVKVVPVTAAVALTTHQKETINGRMVDAALTPPPNTEPERDAVAAMLCDQLALLVNALDNATGAQRAAVREYAEKFAGDTVRPSRARIWHTLATAAIS